MFFQANKLEHRYDPTCSGGITLPESKLKNWCCYSACFLPIRALPNTNSPLGVFNIIIFDAMAVNRLVRTIFKRLNVLNLSKCPSILLECNRSYSIELHESVELPPREHLTLVRLQIKFIGYLRRKCQVSYR
jgi:hypothetical protein